MGGGGKGGTGQPCSPPCHAHVSAPGTTHAPDGTRLAHRGRQFPFVRSGTKPSPPSPPRAQRGVCAPSPGATMGKQALPLHSSNNAWLQVGEPPCRRLAAPTAGSAATVTRGAKRGHLPRGLGRSSGAGTPQGHDTLDKLRQAGMKAGR